MQASSRLDLERFAATPLISDPFDHVIVPGFVRAAACAEIESDFPAIGSGGSYPAASLSGGANFDAFLGELESQAMRKAVEAKFGIDLTGRPTMVTLRGQSRARDGRIHTDSATKLMTALIYMNPVWEADGGRLRLLRDAEDIENYAAEVPPARGTLLIFRCTPNAYHGHKPFVGQRRSIQLNWLTSSAVLKRELTRHGLSAWTKRLFKGAAASR
jgi:SM-20-related protein